MTQEVYSLVNQVQRAEHIRTGYQASLLVLENDAEHENKNMHRGLLTQVWRGKLPGHPYDPATKHCCALQHSLEPVAPGISCVREIAPSSMLVGRFVRVTLMEN